MKTARKVMKIMTTLGIPHDICFCTPAEMKAYPKFQPIIQKKDGLFVPIRFIQHFQTIDIIIVVCLVGVCYNKPQI